MALDPNITPILDNRLFIYPFKSIKNRERENIITAQPEVISTKELVHIFLLIGKNQPQIYPTKIHPTPATKSQLTVCSEVFCSTINRPANMPNMPDAIAGNEL